MKHNGREMNTEPHVDFDYSAVDADREADGGAEGPRQCRVEFELAQRITLAIAGADNSAVAADQVLWIFQWIKQSTHALARKHNYSQPGFLKGAHALAGKLGIRLSRDAE